MSIGGSIESISINGRGFAVAADADANRDLGGFTSEQQSNGDGTTRDIKTRKPWMIDGLNVSIDDFRRDQEFLQENSDGSANGVIDITFANGAVYSGTGKVSGDLKASSQSATMPITLSGPGKLEQQ